MAWAARLGLSLLLTISLTMKVVSSDVTSGTLNREAATSHLADFLAAEGFVLTNVSPFDDFKMLTAYKTSCRLRAAILPEEGFASRALTRLADETEAAYFIFDGAEYRTHPLIQSLVAKYMDRIKRGIRMGNSARMVVGVLKASECDNLVNWRGLKPLVTTNHA